MAEFFQTMNVFLKRNDRNGSARTIVMAVAAFVLGAVAALYFAKQGPATPAVHHAGLTDATAAALQNLQAPVGIRFYSLLDPASVDEATRDFAVRVDELLATYAEASAGKVTITRQVTRNDQAATAASADHIKAFNLDKGDACFLGLALTSQGRSESMAQLLPEWEQALEFDLTRAILRLSAPAATGANTAVSTQPAAAAITEVKSLVPKFETLSVEQASEALRDRSYKAFSDATKQMRTLITEAEQKVADAKSGSEADQQAAQQALLKIQAEQTEKLKEIAAQLQSQISALEFLKKK